MAVKYYRAVLSPDGEGGFGIMFPEFAGCTSVGDDLQDAAGMAEEALSLHLRGMLEDGETIPEPVNIGDPLPDWMAEDIAAEQATYFEILVRAELPGKAVRVNVTMTEDVLASLDRAAQKLGTSRSAYLAHAVRETVRREHEAA